MDIWQASVNQAREETGYRGPDISRTPNAIGEALRIDRRTEFYNAVATAGDGNTFEGVVNLWWPQAVIDSAPEDPAAEDFIDLTFAHYADQRRDEPRQVTHEDFMAEMEHAQ